jgi:hypothetical protein
MIRTFAQALAIVAAFLLLVAEAQRADARLDAERPTAASRAARAAQADRLLGLHDERRLSQR